MRRSMSSVAFVLVALLAATRPVRTEDKTSLIELDRRAEALPGGGQRQRLGGRGRR